MHKMKKIGLMLLLSVVLNAHAANVTPSVLPAKVKSGGFDVVNKLRQNLEKVDKMDDEEKIEYFYNMNLKAFATPDMSQALLAFDIIGEELSRQPPIQTESYIMKGVSRKGKSVHFNYALTGQQAFDDFDREAVNELFKNKLCQDMAWFFKQGASLNMHYDFTHANKKMTIAVNKRYCQLK